MSRKTRDPFVLAILATALSAGCSGETTDTGRKPPEICDDAIDNDDDGLVDCDDTEECGGLQCATGTESDTGAIDLPDLEIVFDVTTCCNFTFTGPGDCPMVIGTYVVSNRTDDEVAELDASCDLVSGDPPFQFNVPDCGNCPVPYLTNYNVGPGETITVDINFNRCSLEQSITGNCVTDISANGAIPSSVEIPFHPIGTFVE